MRTIRRVFLPLVILAAFAVAIPGQADGRFQRGPGPKYCPSNGDRSWNAKRVLLGKTLPAARAIARRHGCTVRVAKRDGIGLVVTSDLRPNRLNVAIVGKSKIVKRIIDVA